MKKSNLKNLNVADINANMVKGGRKLRPGGTTNGSQGWGSWGNNTNNSSNNP